MKKFLALMLSLALVFALAACGQSASSPAASAAENKTEEQNAGRNNRADLSVFNKIEFFIHQSLHLRTE